MFFPSAMHADKFIDYLLHNNQNELYLTSEIR